MRSPSKWHPNESRPGIESEIWASNASKAEIWASNASKAILNYFESRMHPNESRPGIEESMESNLEYGSRYRVKR